MAIDPNYAKEAQEALGNPFGKAAGLINSGVEIGGQLLEATGVPGAGAVGNALGGGGKEVKMGSPAPNLSLPQATPAPSNPSNMQGGQFNNVIETTGSLKPAATAAPAALEAGASAAKATSLI